MSTGGLLSDFFSSVLFRDRAQKRVAHARASRLAGKNVVEGHELAVHNPGFILILGYDGAAEINPGKESARPPLSRVASAS